MDLDTPTLVRLASQKARDQFVAELPFLFLVVSTPNETGRHALVRALTTTQTADELSPVPGKRALEILPLRKREGGTHPDRISIGRAANCDVVLRDPSISKLQAWFRPGPASDRHQLCDFESKNGTRINGVALAPNQPSNVAVGDHVEFGRMACKLLDSARLHDLLRALGTLKAAPANFKKT